MDYRDNQWQPTPLWRLLWDGLWLLLSESSETNFGLGYYWYQWLFIYYYKKFSICIFVEICYPKWHYETKPNHVFRTTENDDWCKNFGNSQLLHKLTIPGFPRSILKGGCPYVIHFTPSIQSVSYPVNYLSQHDQIVRKIETQLISNTQFRVFPSALHSPSHNRPMPTLDFLCSNDQLQ